ncbi:DUF4352 domain-containing protein [Streptomyces sp. NPDC003753]|uniref:DUF4352 domain-containing protein n=1 Tax=Streptomyces sp. Y2F8-2 TaxID=2759675 RepID=UPI0019039CFE|nr:DUF4352 domain-containing protein [Streptomyces sp. Y2F8-2]GHJ99745.1 hypothetical protein SY2F82_15430 [Streptomyces sp. Y2F8-2]
MSQQQYPQQQPGWGDQQQPGWNGPQQPGYGAPPPFQPQPPKKSNAGKVIGFGCLGVVAVAVVIGIVSAVVGSGGGSTVTDKPQAKASAAAGAGGSQKKATEEPAAKKPEVAKVGDTITVKGMEDGSRLDVTVVKVADPAKSSDEFMTPDAGKRYVGVQFRLVNTGTAVYGDSPSNGAQVADTQGQQFESTFADITAGPSMSADVKLKPGAKALGWIVFEVPKGSKVATVQFTMDSGFADQTGEWKLP